MSEGPFDGLRVLDLTRGLAGAYAGKMLVDAGADVAMVEPPQGHPLRRWSASGRDLAPGEDGALFHYLAGSKASVVLDFARAADLDTLRAHVSRADLVYLDHRSEAADALDLAALQAANPRLCLVSVTPWGVTGPWAGRPATEFTLQAAAGSLAYRGLRDRVPVCAGGQLGEWASGAYAAVAGLMAALAARRRGRGEHVDLSMYEVTAQTLTVFHDLQGQFFEGSLIQNLETPSIEPTRDGWVGLCAYTGQQWKDFCLMIGRPEIAEDDRFFDARARNDHLPFIQEAIHAFTRTQSTEEILELASAMRIPTAPIGNGRNVLEMEQFRERGVFVENPAGFRQPRRPYRLSSGAERAPAAAPVHGTDSDGLASRWSGERPHEPGDGAALPFEGLRVVDLTAFWAGPAVTAVLAEFGADVVKIESCQRPDGMRFAGAVREPPLWERSPVFHGNNTEKRDITLDLDSEEGKALLWRLLEDADVVIENFSARVMDHFGLTWEALHAHNERLVMVRMPAWGLDGPWRDRVGFAANVEQASGLAWITGYPDMPLIVRGVCDPVGGMHALTGLLCALEERRRTGKGQRVECALAEPALAIAAEQVIEWTAYGTLLERDTNRGPAAAPQGCYPCAGGPSSDRETWPNEPWVALAVEDDAQWRGLVRALGEPAWAKDPAFDSAAGRRARHDEIDEGIAAWSREHSAEGAAALLRNAGVPASPLVNAHWIVPNPQLSHRRFHTTLEHPVMGATRYPRFPANFSAMPAARIRSAAPTLGQHNDEVLGGELGLSQEERDALRERGVIGETLAFEL